MHLPSYVDIRYARSYNVQHRMAQHLPHTGVCLSTNLPPASLLTRRRPQYMQAQCATGYRGVLCSECDVGYGWSDEANCVKCRSKVGTR